jgi:phenylalanyl-tRNA synthetase beta chain
VVTNSLVNPKELQLVNPADSPVALLNPLNPEMSVLRTSMVPSLLNVAKWNFSRNIQALSVFEIGRVFLQQAPGALPREDEVVAGLLAGARTPPRWDGKNEQWDFYHARGLAESLLKALTGVRAGFDRAGDAGFNLVCQGKPIGKITVVPGDLMRAFDLKGTLYYFELALDRLFEIRRTGVRYRPVSKFPPSDRDMAVVVPESADVNAMLDAIRAESPFFEHVGVFDVFKSKELGPGRKSVAFSMRLRRPDGTLTDPEVDAIFKKAVRTIEQRFKGVLRV